jgi:hypothetical protein
MSAAAVALIVGLAAFSLAAAVAMIAVVITGLKER